MEESKQELVLDINALPESCIAHILSLTSPADVCRLAAVSSAFRRAAESDTVWARFLPQDHRDILSRTTRPVTFYSKKELYRRFCDSILIDAGTASFGLERLSGEKHLAISARGLKIVWGDNPRYWTWKFVPNSRFGEVAELLAVRWLEIQARVDARFLSAATTYSAHLVYNVAQGSYGLTFPSQEASVKMGADISRGTVCLQPDDGCYNTPQPRPTILGRPLVFQGPAVRAHTHKPPHVREDGWLELEIGKFSVDDGNEGKVDISLMEVKGGQWKGGLIVQGIEIRPQK